MPKTIREYSREFTPASGDGSAITIRRIPTPLYQKARAKARREGVSIRALLLRRLAEYAEERA